MSAIAMVLVLVSVGLHVAWNLFSKRDSSAAFLLVANVFGGALLLPVAAVHAARLPDVPLDVWRVLVATGVCQAVYLAGLAAAYRRGDLSLVYPLARSLPPVLVVLAGIALGRGERIGPLCIAGIALIVVGGLLLPLGALRQLRPGRYWNAYSGLAVLAALGTAGYSLLDDQGLRLLRGTEFSPSEATLIYAPFEAWSTSVFLSCWVAARRSERAALRSLDRAGWLRASVAGVGMYGSYTLILAAMNFAQDVSYVVGFRQLSVPLGAIVGVAVLHEPSSGPKWVGIGFASAGLVLIGIG